MATDSGGVMITRRTMPWSIYIVLLVAIEVVGFYASACFLYDDVSIRNFSEYMIRGCTENFFLPWRIANRMTPECMGIALMGWIFLVSYMMYHFRNWQGGMEHGAEDWADAIGGYNAFLEKQKTANGKALVSTVLFNDGVTVLYDRLPLEQVPAMTGKDYSVDGCTALLDAMGETIHRIRKLQKGLPEERRPAKTVFVITTDGLENASRQYTYDKVKKMVEKRKEKNGWEFLFLGANIDAIEVAGQVGIAKDRAVNFVNDAKGTSLNYSTLSKAVCQMRAMPGAALPEDWKAEIEADIKKRSKSR